MSPNLYTKEPFLTVKNEIVKLYPTFSTTLISKVEFQVVSGSIYFVSFTLKGSTIKYEVSVFVPLPNTNNKVSVLYLKKNGVVTNC